MKVLTGTPHRRRWSDAQKTAIVAESLALGAVTSVIALRHGLHRNQLYGLWREFRSTAIADADIPASDFVPVVVESSAGFGAAAIEIGAAIVRVRPRMDPVFLGEVLRLLR